MQNIELPINARLTTLFSKVIEVSTKLMVCPSKYLPEWLYCFDAFALLKYNVTTSPVAQQTDIIVSIISESDLIPLSIMSGKDINVLKNRLDTDVLGFYAKDQQGKYAGYKWLKITNNHFEEQYNYSIPLPPYSAWTFDHYVKPNFRKQGIWKKMTEFEICYAKSLGIESLYCYVGLLNQASLQAHKSICFNIICKYAYICICGVKFIFPYGVYNI